MRKIVNDAISVTKTILGDYFENTCRQRLASGVGSCYDGLKSLSAMEQALRNADWEEVQHPDVMPGCRAYLTRDIPGGRFGLIEIDSLPDDVELTAIDPKHTGKISLAVAGVRGAEVKETYLIIGPEEMDGVTYQVVYTFHPGEPVRSSMVEVADIPDGTKLTKAQAKELGLSLAKIV